MQVTEQIAEVGQVEFRVHGGGRLRRHVVSQFSVRCDAIVLHENEILLLSIVGPETSVKALLAGLRSSRKEQERISYSVNVGGLARDNLVRCPDGYRVHRARLDYGLWHVLCQANREGFMPVLTEETVWQHLQTDRFTTPLVRDWMPWLMETMREREKLVELEQCGANAGLLCIDDAGLDVLVSSGLKTGRLCIPGQRINGSRVKKFSENGDIQTLDDYLQSYGSMLGKQAERSLAPLHVPGRDSLPALALAREPFDAQAHVVEATRKALCRQKAILMVGEMGTGKTLMAMAAVHAHASVRAYRALVLCPGQLLDKWEREIHETIPGATVMQIESWRTLLNLDRSRRPAGAEWYIIARDRAKLGAKWRPACLVREKGDGFLCCPKCGRRLVTDQREPLRLGDPGKNGQAGTGLWKRRTCCEWVLANADGQDADKDDGDRLVQGCGSALWQMTGEVWRFEPALYIKRRLKRFFKYLLLDEVHEEKGLDTAQGHAAGALAASCRKVIALTGTLIGGYAEHLRPLLFRLSPRSLVDESLGWSQATAFNERYGRIETRITEKSGVVGDDNRMSRGSKSTTKSVRPGIMPILFGRHLIDKAVFLRLSEVADNLPPLSEECIPIEMDRELATAYRRDVEEPLAEAIKLMMRKRDRRLLGAMLQTLLAYPDYPFGWGPIGYWDRSKDGGGKYVTVTTPPSLPEDQVRAKEKVLLDLVKAEQARGRRVWIFVQYTDRHDVQARLEKLLRDANVKVAVLRANVPLAKREEWIARNAPGLDVIVSHPRLVETGLDLFDKNGRHNFPTICFYETGYNLFTLRQAARRSWRIGQREPCRIAYFYYEGTMQDRALALMGKKLTAAQALEGSFCSEGLVAMAGEDANMELALARSLVNRLDEGDTRRSWNKLSNAEPAPKIPNALPDCIADRLWQPDAMPPAAIPIPSFRERGRNRQRLAAAYLF